MCGVPVDAVFSDVELHEGMRVHQELVLWRLHEHRVRAGQSPVVGGAMTKQQEARNLRAKSRAITSYVGRTRELQTMAAHVWWDAELKALEALAQSQLVLAAALEMTGPFGRVVV